ncbi:hypothetical protein PMAYCL1PPCAC_22121, partial [Pristionchus mayeri]
DGIGIFGNTPQNGDRKTRKARPKLQMDDLATQITKSTAGENYEEVCIKNVFKRIKFESTHMTRPEAYDANISASLPGKLNDNLGMMNVKQLLPTQRYTLPLLVDHDTDLFVGAATGHGKTLGFLIPVVVGLLRQHRDGSSSRRPRALVISNTQVLQIQTFNVCKNLIAGTGLRAVLVCGEALPREQIRELEQGVDILIATTGRLKDFLQKKVLSLEDLKYFIYDEADKMTQFGGFRDDVREIDSFIPQAIKDTLRSCFFTATLDSISIFEGMYREGKVSMLHVPGNPLITHQIIPLDLNQDNDNAKSLILMRLMQNDIKSQCRTLFDKSNAPYMQKTVVFVNEKQRCNWLGAYLRPFGFSVGVITSDYSLKMRDHIIQRFTRGEIQALIATDSMARGHDIPNVTHVINYDVGDNALDTFKHRAGRTARIGHKGTCTTLLSKRQFMLYDDPTISECSGPRLNAAKLARYLVVECGQKIPLCLMGPARIGLKSELTSHNLKTPLDEVMKDLTSGCLAKALRRKARRAASSVPNVPQAIDSTNERKEQPQILQPLQQQQEQEQRQQLPSVPIAMPETKVEFDEDGFPCFERPESSEVEEEEADNDNDDDDDFDSDNETGGALMQDDDGDSEAAPHDECQYDEDAYFMGEHLDEGELDADANNHMILEYAVHDGGRWTSDEGEEDSEENRFRALVEDYEKHQQEEN